MDTAQIGVLRKSALRALAVLFSPEDERLDTICCNCAKTKRYVSTAFLRMIHCG